MEVFVGADYRGFYWKQKILEHLARVECPDGKLSLHDMGDFEQKESSDYNDPAVAVAKAVREEPEARGILICGSGHGMTIQANRFRGVRAAKCDNPEAAKLARGHDDANVLCLAAEVLNEDLMAEILYTFFKTQFDNNIERRVRRVNRLDEREDYA